MQILEDMLVLEADDPVSSLLEVLGSGEILVYLEVVDRPVDLHYKSMGMAVEIDNESADGVLSAELQACKLSVA